ncbi:MAG: 16S rRNA (uracil(1498)-N(3))-methyltransferase [Alcanivoracaceae bacterium]|nr:16S rRNA (uracil(1498)-N(3))-methyltransferase [Alcanivoracaceae bacterium]
MARRFYDSQFFQAGTPALLGENASHHIHRVLRMRPGDELVVFNGEGGEWRARIEDAGKRGVEITPLEFVDTDRTPRLCVTIALPLIKGERMDYALQKATELGAASFQLLDMQRSDVRLGGERLARKMRHWQQVVISACEQCGMNRVPVVAEPLSLAEWLTESSAALKLIAHPGLAPLDAGALAGAATAALLTGPEGGFTAAEMEMAAEAGFRGFALGERVLRAETAPVALLASLHALG